jgi:hypothetical protein
MKVPATVINVKKSEAAARQVDAAIRALEAGDFDIAITLAGAAEGMLQRDGVHLFKFMLESPRVQELDRRDWISTLNTERDWLKHPTPDAGDERQFSRTDAAIMIVRAASKLTHWSPLMEEFRVWLLASDVFD